MKDRFFVSFNSPQCGWMSIGFEDAQNEFHTTTAHAPHSSALPELLTILSELLEKKSDRNEFLLKWNRNPEEFDFVFRRAEENLVNLQIFQYPSDKRETAEREKVYEFTGAAQEICLAFYETFAQMEKDRHVDEFEFNWRQPFPAEEFARFKQNLAAGK